MTLLPTDSPLARIFAAHHGHTGFITRIDRTSLSRKRLLFLRSLVYNVALLGAIVTLFIFYDFSPNAPQSLRMTFSITQGLVLFWAISILCLTTLAPFFFGECLLRWRYGFKRTEVILRRAPRESLAIPESLEKHWRLSLRAINPALLYTNPASILAADFWVLEHLVIMDIYAAMSAGQVNEEDLEFTFWREHDGVWSGLELWRLHHIVSVQQEVDLFKACLRNKGKYDLLSAWERSFNNEKDALKQTPEDYRSIVQRFSQEGIDYEAAWSQIQSMDVA
ncbi:hypothetical protein AGABI2DRAFT_223067 [Agaricus bisporus var. bisporus H97]|uniref:hypothetical protein n=1 Tax=Agaricus bisporus var. bisporus (strain H97 / ATCC MYA-4626 / FGSC 10389) TaxID=936046 RepID=UPI00029F7E2F|nr:hypothetical protein AGABI2DRAFT_223067 [Agaricus bisporus var. bisporus H97]EKV46651.1 hypothetical protein AGABI2DRAFT_223067 [Agaricus bisporus var. bisporus H97]